MMSLSENGMVAGWNVKRRKLERTLKSKKYHASSSRGLDINCTGNRVVIQQ